MTMEDEINYATSWVNSQEDKDTIWKFLKQGPPKNTGFMFMQHAILNRISTGIEERGHSGASFACTMRGLQTKAQEMILH